ncbi:hypothetical protein GGS23DRAFT_583358 [Durotheca rogersii]|uniref:uncharacterized protein n=1 Tax=Durotheca rogersii TaxID=419775 RepID=UPI0022202D28|nr:uncharacterized protein GGS23DRAFT_583358 [Durotheca rogersii]KAI5859986.1 hypothetical protein GGS23DRAFT_583358 [Durotheca rogersii]
MYVLPNRPRLASWGLVRWVLATTIYAPHPCRRAPGSHTVQDGRVRWVYKCPVHPRISALDKPPNTATAAPPRASLPPRRKSAKRRPRSHRGIHSPHFVRLAGGWGNAALRAAEGESPFLCASALARLTWLHAADERGSLTDAK